MDAGPYDRDVCHFCGKKATDKHPEHTAGYQRREIYATVGPWFDACEACARVPYKQPEQLRKEEKEEAVSCQ